MWLVSVLSPSDSPGLDPFPRSLPGARGRQLLAGGAAKLVDTQLLVDRLTLESQHPQPGNGAPSLNPLVAATNPVL